MAIRSDEEFNFAVEIRRSTVLSAVCKSYFPEAVESFAADISTYHFVHVYELVPGVSLDTAIAAGSFGEVGKGPKVSEDIERINRVWDLLKHADKCLHDIGLIHGES